MGSKKMARSAMLALLVLATASAVLASSEGGVDCDKAGKALASTCQAFGEDSDACHTVRLYHTASCKLLIREPVIGESEEKTAPSAKKLAKAVAKAKSKSADKAEKKAEKKEITKEAAASTAVNSGKMPVKNTMNKKAQHAATRKEDAIKRATSTKNKKANKVSSKKSKSVAKAKDEKKASKAMKALRRVKAGKPAKKKVSKKQKKAIKKAIKKGGSTKSKTSSKAVKKAEKAASVDHVAMAKRTVRLANEVYSRAQKMCKFDK